MPDLLDLDTGDVPPRQHSTAATRDLAWSSRRRTLLLTSGLILSSELCERLAYYSLSTNLVGRLASLGFSPGAASSATAAWSGASYLVALLGAWLADAVIGRYWVIFGGSVLYQLGLAAVVAVTALEAGAAALTGDSRNEVPRKLKSATLYFSLKLSGLSSAAPRPQCAHGASE